MTLRRLMRVALRVTLLRAWTLRSGRWLAVAIGLVVGRLLQRTGAPRREAT